MRRSVHRYPALEMSDLFRNPTLRAYLANVRGWHGYVRFLGLPDRRDNPDVEIGGLFLWPLLARRHVSPDENPANWLGEAERVLDALMIGKPLMLLGDPGSGKTTLLNYLVWLLGRPSENVLIDRLGWRLPVPMALRELRLRGVTDFDGLLAAFLGHAMSEPLREGEYLNEMLGTGQAFILLDGIDEVGDQAARTNLRYAVFDGFARYPDCLWVLSSRIVGYDEAPFVVGYDDTPFDRHPFDEAPLGKRRGSPLEGSAVHEDVGEYSNDRPPSSHGKASMRRASHGFPATGRRPDDAPVVTRFIAPFDDTRIAAFARKWYVQREAAATRAGADASHLVRAVHADPAILRLARVPNLLTMMALIHRIETNLPHGRALLYDRIAEAYLESIDKFRGLHSGAHDLPQKKSWLARIGYEMQRRRSLAEDVDGEAPERRRKAEIPDGPEILVESGDVIALLAAEMERSGTTVGVGSPEEFLGFVGRRSGLFLPRAEGRYAFIHLSFQEYFAAVALERAVTGIDWARRRRSPLGFVRKDLAGWAEQSVWRETFVFLFELLAPKRDWYADLLDCVFGEGFSRLDAPEPDERTLSLACLAARLVVNPRAGLAPAKIRDAVVEGCVRTQLRYQSAEVYDEFLSTDVFMALLGEDREWNAKVLDVIGGQLKMLELRSLSLLGTTISDLTPLANLTGLQHLDLDRTSIKDLTPLSNLTALESLDLNWTSVSDVTPLANLTGLRRLFLEGTPVSDISPLSNLTALESLSLGWRPASDVTPLANLTGLQHLDLSITSVSDLSPLSNLTGLQSLDLTGTEISEHEAKKLRDALPHCDIRT